MSEREFAFGQVVATLEPLSEVELEFAQCIFNAGWDAAQGEVQS